jgi:hypothetical protein
MKPDTAIAKQMILDAKELRLHCEKPARREAATEAAFQSSITPSFTRSV